MPLPPVPVTVEPVGISRSPWNVNCMTPPLRAVVNLVPLNVPPLFTPLMVMAPVSESMLIVCAEPGMVPAMFGIEGVLVLLKSG